MSELEAFLKHRFDNSTTTCYKQYQRFKRMLRNAMHKGYLDKLPFENYKIRPPKKKIQYLTQENIIREIFFFCIYTGLAYAEVEALTTESITQGIDGEPWLNINRKKTKKDYQVPLFPQAIAILEKYQVLASRYSEIMSLMHKKNVPKKIIRDI